MIINISEGDQQAATIIQLLKRSCNEEVVGGRNLVLQRRPGSFVREMDGSLPERLTFVGHGDQTTFGERTAEAFVNSLKEQLGSPSTTPIKKIDLVGCNIGLVTFDEQKNPLIETRDTHSKNYCYAQDVAERLRAAGYDIQLNVFSNRTQKKSFAGMEFTKLGEEFCLIAYNTAIDVSKNDKIFSLREKILEREAHIELLNVDIEQLNAVIAKKPVDAKAINAKLQDLTLKLPTIITAKTTGAEALEILSGMKSHLVDQQVRSENQIKKLANEIQFSKLCDIEHVRESLDANPDFHFSARSSPTSGARLNSTASILRTSAAASPNSATPAKPTDRMSNPQNVAKEAVSLMCMRLMSQMPQLDAFTTVVINPNVEAAFRTLATKFSNPTELSGIIQDVFTSGFGVDAQKKLSTKGITSAEMKSMALGMNQLHGAFLGIGPPAPVARPKETPKADAVKPRSEEKKSSYLDRPTKGPSTLQAAPTPVATGAAAVKVPKR